MNKKILISLIISISAISFIFILNKENNKNQIAEINSEQNFEQEEQDKIQKEIINQEEKSLKQDPETSSEENQQQKNKSDDSSTKKDNYNILDINEHDIILGNPNAKVTMIEYASLSCPHCAYFIKDSFPKIDKEYIKTGKVRFIYRDFPLDKTALIAGSIAKCHALNNLEKQEQEYYNLIKLFFNSQDSWAGHSDFIKKLEVISKIQGIESEIFQSCLNREDIQEQILLRRIAAAKNLKISSTPTFFINGKMISGFTDFNKIKNIIEIELKNIQ